MTAIEESAASPRDINADVEKGALPTPTHDTTAETQQPPHDSDNASVAASSITESKWAAWAERLSGLEVRGIRRVEDHEKSAKTTLSPLQIVLLWLGINTAPQNITLAMIGVSAYELGFVDASLCAIFGGIIGSLPAAYTATWGPISGNRTMVSRLIDVRNDADFLGLCAIHDGVVASQGLRAAQSRCSLGILHD